MGEEIKIKAEPLNADPDCCRFTVSTTVQPGGPFYYNSAEACRGKAPLAEALFALPGVKSVLIADDVVTVGKASDVEWMKLMKLVGSTIRFQLQSGVPAVTHTSSEPRKRPETDAELHDEVMRVLEEGINPFVAEHGGKILLDRVEAAVAYIQMTGGCQGCSSSSATLRQGVVALIHEEIPEIVNVVDVTDHASGEAPYFAG